MEQKVHIPCLDLAGANHIEVEVMYMKGEQWSSCYKRRGYYLAVRPIKITPMEFEGVPYNMFSMGECPRPSQIVLLEETERKSPKRLAELVSRIMAHAKEIADAYVRQDYAKVGTIIAVA